jgi:hypothetical protein
VQLAEYANEFARWQVALMEWEFDAEVFQWRGPAPYFFVETPDEVDAFLQDHAAELTYGRRCHSSACADRRDRSRHLVDTA